MSDPKYTAARARFVFGQDMQPCPKCGSFHIGYSTPIKLEGATPSDAKGWLAAWAKARKQGATPLEGTACIMCRECAHCGPPVDVSGRTAEDVGRDPVVATEAKRRWNAQRKEAKP